MRDCKFRTNFSMETKLSSIVPGYNGQLFHPWKVMMLFHDVAKTIFSPINPNNPDLPDSARIFASADDGWLPNVAYKCLSHTMVNHFQYQTRGIKKPKKKKAKMHFLTFSALVKSNHQNRQNDQIMITVCIR